MMYRLTDRHIGMEKQKGRKITRKEGYLSTENDKDRLNNKKAGTVVSKSVGKLLDNELFYHCVKFLDIIVVSLLTPISV